MFFRFGNIVVDIDIEKTTAFYQSFRKLTDDCSCAGCQNFVYGVDRLSHDILDFFLKLGIDILKPTEMTVLCSEDNGESIYYEGWYHICGRLISDSDCWSHKTDNKGAVYQSINAGNLFPITDNFSIGFTNTISLKVDDFPKPIVQMETFIHHFPWVLDTSNKF